MNNVLFGVVLAALCTPGQAASIPRRLISGQTGAVLLPGRVEIVAEGTLTSAENRVGVLGWCAVGLPGRLSLGIAYGMDTDPSTTQAQPYPFPPGWLKWQCMRETWRRPALSLGVDLMGLGGQDHAKREHGFIIPSPGIFLAISKQYALSREWHIGFNGVLTYSLETADEVAWPSGTAGLQVGLFHRLYWMVEYDMGLNDATITRGRPLDRHYLGYCNMGLRANIIGGLHLQVHVYDLFANRTHRHPVTDRLFQPGNIWAVRLLLAPGEP